MRVLVVALALGLVRATEIPPITTFAELEAAVGAGGAHEVEGHIVFERQLTIGGNTTLNLTSSTGATLSGGGATRLFRVGGDAVVAFHQLTLRDGKDVVRHAPPPRTPLRHSHILRRPPRPRRHAMRRYLRAKMCCACARLPSRVSGAS